ncbi:MAG: glycerol kinase, partial [Dehalococcoidia bacterium]|nr:glycerol kinase [Dehalococcoidia bacterium]
MTHILAIDQGTTSTRAIVFDAQDARPIASAQIELKQHFPQPGWVEHDPIAIVNAAVSVARQAVERAGLHMRDIACMGITNQRETTVVWERATGRPVANAIVWQCRRTAEVCRNLEDAGHGPDIRSRTGLVLDAYFSATKLRWLLDHVPDG